MKIRHIGRIAFFAIVLLVSTGGGDAITIDFSSDGLPTGWSVRGKEWEIRDHALLGKGDGALVFTGPVLANFKLTFKGQSAEKANFEVKLYDASTGTNCYTFAFLGRYHSALKGVACCLLRQDEFVVVDRRDWIYPGRQFTFEIRAAEGQFQMLLDGALGPVFVDPHPLAPKSGMKLEILAQTEGSRDEIRINDLRLDLAAAK